MRIPRRNACGAAALRALALGAALATCQASALAQQNDTTAPPAGAGAPQADAQDRDARARALELFEEAGKAMDAQRYDEACPKFAQAFALVPGKIGVMLALADCYAAAGKLASAWTAYVHASKLALATEDERAARAKAEAAALEPRLARLTIQVPRELASLEGLQIFRDGEPVSMAEWGKAIPTDAGEHEIAASAIGKRRWSTWVTLTAGTTAWVNVLLLDSEAKPPSPPRPSYADPVDTSRPVPAWAWVTGALGVAATGAAIGFLVDQTATQSTFNATCKRAQVADEQTCEALQSHLHRSFGLWVGLGSVGIAGLVAGTYGIAKAKAAPRVAATISMTTAGGGMVVRGSF